MVELNEKALLPCPFCGGEGVSCSLQQPQGSKWRVVMCSSCQSRTYLLATEAEAIAAWNRRATPALPAPDGLVVVAFLHPNAGWAHHLYSEIDMHCRKEGPRPVPLVRQSEAATAIQTLQRERDEYRTAVIKDSGNIVPWLIGRAQAAEQQVRDMREALQFYADPKTYQEQTRERWAADNPGKDPTVAIRCGRFSVEAKPGHVVAPIYLDDAGHRARLLLKEGGE